MNYFLYGLRNNPNSLFFFCKIETGTLMCDIFVFTYTNSHLQTWIHTLIHTQAPGLLSLCNAVKYWLSGNEVAC